MVVNMGSRANYGGALHVDYGTKYTIGRESSGQYPTKLNFNANGSNAIYTDNGLVLPNSISKQSYIIYK